jgi:DHA1 family inner membrane transport protein
METKGAVRFTRHEMSLLFVLCVAQWVIITTTMSVTYLFPAISQLFDTPLGTVVLLTTATSFSGLLATLFGPLVDRYSRYPFLLGGLAVFALGNLACAAAPSFWFLLAFQAAIGVGYAVLMFVLNVYIGDFFAYGVRGRAMGMMYLAASLALITGVPIVTIVADQYTVRVAFLAMAGLIAVTLVLSNIVLPRGRPPYILDTSSPHLLKAQHAYIVVLRQKEALAGLLAQFLWAMPATGVFIFLASWLKDTFGFTDAQIGGASAAVGIGGLVGGGLATIGTDRLGKKQTALAGIILGALSAAALPWSGTVWLTIGCLLIFAAGLSLGTSPFVAILTELNPEFRATLMSLNSLCIGVSSSLTPLLMRPLWQAGGYVLVTAVLGAVGLSAALTIGLFVTRRRVSVPASG